MFGHTLLQVLLVQGLLLKETKEKQYKLNQDSGVHFLDMLIKLQTIVSGWVCLKHLTECRYVITHQPSHVTQCTINSCLTH